jgi:hypothetical protein
MRVILPKLYHSNGLGRVYACVYPYDEIFPVYLALNRVPLHKRITGEIMRTRLASLLALLCRVT